MTRFAKSGILAISVLMVAAVIVAGCSSPLTPDKQQNMTEGVAFDEIKVVVFQPPT